MWVSVARIGAGILWLFYFIAEIGNGFGEAFDKLNGWFPAKFFFREADIWAALSGIILRQRLVDEFTGTLRQQLEHFFGELLDGEFPRVTGINWAGKVVAV